MTDVTMAIGQDIVYLLAGHLQGILVLLIFSIGFAISAGPIIPALCSEIYMLAARDPGVKFQSGGSARNDALKPN
jgi:hypothetical protein